jgi:hypothetical protein
MIISGLDNDIEFTIQEGNFTIDECVDLIQSSHDKSNILKECNIRKRNRENLEPKHSETKEHDIKSIFVQPRRDKNVIKGNIQTIDEFKQLMVVAISENTYLYHPDTNYFYELPLNSDFIQSLEMEDIETLFRDNIAFIYHKLEKPIIACALLSIEGVEYL